ncbi:MAG: MFS transporter [Holosporales bacterium]|jgi:MFS family permease|nr:MFS transporter [Holosporales bacterium]
MKIKDFFSVSDNKNNNATIMWLCWMHFCWGVAASMIFSLLPIFIVDELGGDSKSFGLLEGSVIFLAFTSKLLAGFIIDAFKKKLPMLKAGTLFTIVSKLLFACASNMFFVFIAKAIDRFFEGLRRAPSDAILAELASKKGFAYSFRHMMNISGYFLGSIITSQIVYIYSKNFRVIFTLAIIPTVVALYILTTKIKYDKDSKSREVRAKHKWKIKDITLMPKGYWHLIITISLLFFNRFSEGFITLRAKEILPDSIGSFPLFMSIYEIFAISVAIPFGKLSDKFDKRKTLLLGIAILFIADIFGIIANNVFTIVAIYIFAGIHYGATHGILGALVAQTAPKHLIGTALAFYYGIDGIVLFFSNNLAGRSSGIARFIGLEGSSGPFIVGALVSLLAMLYLYCWLKKEKFK